MNLCMPAPEREEEFVVVTVAMLSGERGRCQLRETRLARGRGTERDRLGSWMTTNNPAGTVVRGGRNAPVALQVTLEFWPPKIVTTELG